LLQLVVSTVKYLLRLEFSGFRPSAGNDAPPGDDGTPKA
jgi:hypothetical protein